MQISHKLHFLFRTLQCALHHFEKTCITESNVLHRFQITNITCLYQSRLWLFCSLSRLLTFLSKTNVLATVKTTLKSQQCLLLSLNLLMYKMNMHSTYLRGDMRNKLIKKYKVSCKISSPMCVLQQKQIINISD